MEILTPEGCRTCPGKIEIPTPKEQEALEAMRAIKNEGKALELRIAALQAERPEGWEGVLEDLQQRRDVLRTAWKDWEARREEAARERMVLLGHEDP